MKFDAKTIKKLQEIGSGGQSKIYKYDENGRVYAVKRLINTKRLERFRIEIDATIYLHKEGCKVVDIIDYDLDCDAPYYVMPLYKKGSLDIAWKDQFQGATIEERANTFIEIACDLDKIHELGYLHRDIKAENILVGDSDEFLFADFGISLTKEYSDVRQTGTEEIIGSRFWVAPEFHNGRLNNGSEAGDYFSMGKLLFFILTGRRLLGIGLHDAKDYADLPSSFHSILNAMLSLDPFVRQSLWKDCIEALKLISRKSKKDKVVTEDSIAKIAAQEIVRRAQKENHWKTKTMELKWEVINGIKSQRLAELTSELLRSEMIQLTNECGNVSSLSWMSTNRNKLLKCDDGKNGYIRFWSKNSKIYFTPVALIGNAPSNDYSTIQIVVGIGVQYERDGEGGMPLLLENCFFSFECNIDSPLLQEHVADLIQKAEAVFYEKVCEMIRDEYWLTGC